MYLVISGLFTGLLVGLTGVGGGSILTPLLLLVFGIAPTTAIGTDLWFAAVTKSVAVGAHHDSNLIDWMIVKRLWAGSLPAAIATILLMKFGVISIDVSFLQKGIGFAVLVTGMGLIFQEPLHALGERLRLTDSQHFKELQRPLTVIAGAFLGVMVSLTSIGAGAFGAVIMTYLYPLRLPPSKLVATDIAHAIPLTIVAGIGHMAIGHLDWSLLFHLLAGSIPGVLLGVYLSSKLPQVVLRGLLIACLMMVGGKLLWH